MMSTCPASGAPAAGPPNRHRRRCQSRMGGFRRAVPGGSHTLPWQQPGRCRVRHGIHRVWLAGHRADRDPETATRPADATRPTLTSNDRSPTSGNRHTTIPSRQARPLSPRYLAGPGVSNSSELRRLHTQAAYAGRTSIRPWSPESTLATADPSANARDRCSGNPAVGGSARNGRSKPGKPEGRQPGFKQLDRRTAKADTSFSGRSADRRKDPPWNARR